MRLLRSQSALLLTSIASTTAAVLPRLDNGLGAQLSDFPLPVPTTPAPQLLPSTGTPPAQSSTTSHILQDNERDNEAVAAVNDVLGSSTNSTSTNITTTDPVSLESQEISLNAQAVQLAHNALSAQNASATYIDLQSLKKPTAPVAKPEPTPTPAQGGGDGLLAQGDGSAEMDFGPSRTSSSSPLPAYPALGAAATTTTPPSLYPSSSSSSIVPHPITITTTTTTSATPGNVTKPTPSLIIPQDNGLQAQDSGSINFDFNPASNTTSSNEPHEQHDADGTLVVPSVQDTGLQSQDASGANVVWTLGEVYDGGKGGDVNVPEVVNGGVAAQERL